MLGYPADFTATAEHVKLAVEVDGFEYHSATRAQVASDYIRERRIARAGYLVLRFTATEAINRPDLAWREVFATIRAWERLQRSA